MESVSSRHFHALMTRLRRVGLLAGALLLTACSGGVPPATEVKILYPRTEGNYAVPPHMSLVIGSVGWMGGVVLHDMWDRTAEFTLPLFSLHPSVSVDGRPVSVNTAMAMVQAVPLTLTPGEHVIRVSAGGASDTVRVFVSRPPYRLREIDEATAQALIRRTRPLEPIPSDYYDTVCKDIRCPVMLAHPDRQAGVLAYDGDKTRWHYYWLPPDPKRARQQVMDRKAHVLIETNSQALWGICGDGFAVVEKTDALLKAWWVHQGRVRQKSVELPAQMKDRWINYRGCSPRGEILLDAGTELLALSPESGLSVHPGRAFQLASGDWLEAGRGYLADASGQAWAVPVPPFTFRGVEKPDRVTPPVVTVVSQTAPIIKVGYVLPGIRPGAVRLPEIRAWYRVEAAQ